MAGAGGSSINDGGTSNPGTPNPTGMLLIAFVIILLTAGGISSVVFFRRRAGASLPNSGKFPSGGQLAADHPHSGVASWDDATAHMPHMNQDTL